MTTYILRCISFCRYPYPIIISAATRDKVIASLKQPAQYTF